MRSKQGAERCAAADGTGPIAPVWAPQAAVGAGAGLKIGSNFPGGAGNCKKIHEKFFLEVVSSAGVVL